MEEDEGGGRWGWRRMVKKAEHSAEEEEDVEGGIC